MDIENQKNSDQDLKDAISQNQHVFVMVSASWCGPCRAMYPIVDELMNEFKNVEFCYADADACPVYTSKHGVKSIPTFHFFKDGQLGGTIIAAASKDTLKQFIEKAIA